MSKIFERLEKRVMFYAQHVWRSVRLTGNTEAVKGGASFGYGYGYSYTDSVIVIAEKCL